MGLGLFVEIIEQAVVDSGDGNAADAELDMAGMGKRD
jgi:hypothetical protein